MAKIHHIYYDLFYRCRYCGEMFSELGPEDLLLKVVHADIPNVHEHTDEIKGICDFIGYRKRQEAAFSDPAVRD